jgi:glycosyltransferase involved in cell wall biosynthesis
MLISVIIPVYNGEKYLQECLESVKACPSHEIECIIVNDGSADGSEEICEQFTAADPRFRLVNKENTGVSDTRNRGMAKAAGEYLFFLDADDYIKYDAWGKILAHAAESKYDMVAYGYYSLFDNGITAAECFKEAGSIDDIRLALLSTPMLNPCWGNLLRRGVIHKNKLSFIKGLKTCEDAVFMIDFVQNSQNGFLCGTCALYYRIHKSSAMHQAASGNKLADLGILFERRKAYLAANFDEGAEAAMHRQFFSVITDLFRFYAKNRKITEIRRIYKKNMENATVAAVIAESKKACLRPFYKKLEYMLMERGYCTCLAFYFKLKSCF